MANWSLAIIFVGLAGFGGLFSFQTKLIYFPDDRPLADCALPATTQYMQIGAEQALLTQADGDNLVIFFHGNAGSACNWRFLGANHLAGLNYDTLVVEYPGYGGDTRAPSKAEIEKILPVIHDWVAVQPYETVSVFGYSLGTGIGSMYAELYGADQVILFAPFDSLYAVALEQGFKVPRSFLTEDYDNTAALSQIDAPIYIFHGLDDDVIPQTHSGDLLAALIANDRNVIRETVTNVGHQGLFDSPDFDTRMARVLRFTKEK